MQLNIKPFITYDENDIRLEFGTNLISFLSSLEQKGFFIKYKKTKLITLDKLKNSINFFLFKKKEYEIYINLAKNDFIKYYQFKNNDKSEYHIRNISHFDDNLKEFIKDNNIIIYSEYHNSEIKIISFEELESFYREDFLSRFYFLFSKNKPIFNGAFIILNDDELLYYTLLTSSME